MPKSLAELPPDVLAGKARLAIQNALDAPEILALLDPPYGEAALSAALADVAALEKATRDQRTGYGVKKGATHSVEAARDAFDEDTYMPHVALARTTFRDEPGTLTALGLDGDREEAFHLWLGQVRQLYHGVLEDAALTARLDAVGIREAELEGALDALEDLAGEERGQEGKKGLAQTGTRKRDSLRLRVARWLGAFREVAEVKLRDHPEWLERLGFLHRTDDPPEIAP